MDKRRRRRLFSVAGAQATSTISVALVLFVLGILAIVGLVTRKVAHNIRENVGFDVVMSEDIPAERIEALRREIASQPFALSVVVHSAEESAARWKEETGEDVVEVLGLNPFSAELEVKVHAAWASGDSLSVIKSHYSQLQDIDEITVHTDMIESVNANIVTAFKVLGTIALALLLISFVLINNTIRLTIYARRFTIHTMRLVGSTASFIRRPFLVSGMWQGLISGIIATGLLMGLIPGMRHFVVSTDSLVSLEEYGAVAAGMIVTGVIICVLAAFISTNRYLRLSYDEMFR